MVRVRHDSTRKLEFFDRARHTHHDRNPSSFFLVLFSESVAERRTKQKTTLIALAR